MEKEKKEIGKLIELLNEYDPYISSDGEHKPNLWGYAYQGHSAVFPKELAESYIISARYGFIKWLVENDKIERKKVGIYAYNYAIAKVDFNHIGYKEPQILHRYLKDDGLLMLLSISDTPIEDLLLYLK